MKNKKIITVNLTPSDLKKIYDDFIKIAETQEPFPVERQKEFETGNCGIIQMGHFIKWSDY